MASSDDASGIYRIRRDRVLRFGFVGILNTCVDFVIFYALASILAVPFLFANVVSTSTALGVSFVLNKRSVFRDQNSGVARQLILFLVGTLFGLWVIQGLIISYVINIETVANIFGSSGALMVAKVTATIITMLWNYLFYSRVVFAERI